MSAIAGDHPSTLQTAMDEDFSRWFMRLHSPVDNASLVFFRIFFGAMMAFHAYETLAKGWIEPLYIRPVMHFTYPGFEWVQPWPGQGMFYHFHVMGLAAIGLALGFCSRFSAVVLAYSMAHVLLIEKAFYLNHYYLMTLISGLMAVVPAHQACSVDAWLRPSLRSATCPAWCLWLLRFQIGLPYFYGGLAKLEPDWLQGYPLGMWLARRDDLFWLKGLMTFSWTPILLSYAGLLIDLLVVPLLLWRWTRWPAYLIAMTFHLMNSSLFDIGIFPWLMMGATLIFFPQDWPRVLLHRIGWKTNAPDPAPAARPATHPVLLSMIGCYLAWQLLFPFRCLVYPGRAIWTEEGHHFAWHMMLREKDVGIRFYIRDPKTGGGGVVDLRSFLSSRQLSRMAKDSDMILTFVHFLRDHFQQHGQGRLQIRVLALVSLNGRKPQLMIDPDVDYARVPRYWGPQPWILPLTEPLRQERWDLPLAEWEQYVECPSPEEMILPAKSIYPRKETADARLAVEDF